MARIIRVEGDGPIEVKPQERSAWICACGLTATAPFCDGSHKRARSEEPGHLYEYGEDGARRCVTIAEAGPASPAAENGQEGGAESGR